MPSIDSRNFPLYESLFHYYSGSVVNIYPYKDQQNYMLNGGTWLAIQFPPHYADGMVVAKIEYTGSAETSITSAMGIVPGNYLFRKEYVGLAMCLRIQ